MGAPEERNGTTRHRSDDMAEPSFSPAVVDSRYTLCNFLLMSLLFSANHGSVVSCLSLSTARLGSAVGAWQSGVLYLSYTLSSVLGPTYVVKKLGARNTLVIGMCVYCVYVGSYVVAVALPPPSAKASAAIFGAIFGGVGAGHLWTAQGSYFGRASEEFSACGDMSSEDATSFLGGLFAAIYLGLEVIMRLFSTVAVEAIHLSWVAIFWIYTIVACISAAGMFLVHNYESTARERAHNDELKPFHQVTVAARLLWTDPKMKYMIPLNAVFGFAAAFVTSYVNGEVVPSALSDANSVYVGVLTSITSGVAAVMSLVFGRVDQYLGKGPVLILGAVSFFFVVFPFVMKPVAESWSLTGLVAVYSLQGIGRSTFEGTLRATFADFFTSEKEGAFANIVLQNGLSTAIGFFLSVNMSCKTQGPYCVEYRDGSLHNVLAFELLVMFTAVFAILGYLRADVLFAAEQGQVEVRYLMDNEGDD